MYVINICMIFLQGSAPPPPSAPPPGAAAAAPPAAAAAASAAGAAGGPAAAPGRGAAALGRGRPRPWRSLVGGETVVKSWGIIYGSGLYMENLWRYG